ncbi:MAG: MFS transporter [Dehalococcoidales bacterium]
MDKRLNEYRSEGSKPRFGFQTFRSFKNPVYRLYFGGMLGQMMSMNMQMLARSLLIYRLTGSAAVLGAMSFANAIPMISLSLFGGVIADRVQKKYVLLIGQAASAIISLSVAITLSTGYLSVEHGGSWWVLVVASVGQGTILGLMMPSRQAIVPEIVKDEEELMNAISLSSMGMNTLRLFAPALAGLLIDAIGFEAVYYVTTGSYLSAVVFISFLPLTSTITLSGGGAIDDIKEGLRYLRKEINIMLVLGFSLVMVVLSMPYILLLPVFADDILKVGATGMGVLMSVSGLGAMAGSLILASLPNRKRGLMLLVSGVLMGSALAAFSFSSIWPLSLTLVVFVGLGQSGQMTLGNTLIQYYVDDQYRGRVMSIFFMQFGFTSFGAFAAGLLAEKVGVQTAVGSFALILVALSVLAIIFLPRIRNLD